MNGVTLFSGHDASTFMYSRVTQAATRSSLSPTQAIFTGLFWRNTLPNLIDATTSADPTLNGVIGAAPNATYVPGHGDVGNVDDVKNFRDYLSFLREQIAPLVQQNKTGDDLVNAALPAVTEKYGKWGLQLSISRSRYMDLLQICGDKENPQP